MKILSISGKNLASLAGDFLVDFEQEPLASAGLFAISGPTGAGKTTLLDALCLALYDATPRMLRGGTPLPDVGLGTVAAQDPRTLLRRGAAEGHAQVDFVGNDNLRYRARWSVRRSYKKASGALQSTSMTLHRLPELTAIGGTKTEVAAEIVKCIGLSFDQFTRAVLLAQNEFSAFLKTDENDRGELLETLTGSAIYSVISRRAHERYKIEQQALQQLKTRLADHIALSAEARCALLAEAAAAQAALALADARKTALEQQLRWHQEAAKLRQNQLQAEHVLEAARHASDVAAPRRSHLALRERAEAARPLQADCLRLQRELSAIDTAMLEAQARLQHSRSVQLQESAQVAAAAARLHTAEQAQLAAAPQLNLAKALDAGIATLAPVHAKTGTQLAAARGEGAQALAAAQAYGAQQADVLRAQESAVRWLAEHAAWETLARQWLRWDSLLTQAQVGIDQLTRLGSEHAMAAQHQRDAASAEQHANAILAESGAHLAALDAARQQTSANLAAIDTDQLRCQREQLQLRREAIVASEGRWSALAEAHARLAQVSEQASALAAAGSAAHTALSEATADGPALNAALVQSERSLQAAELACAHSVMQLRATLTDGQPCPVCGGAEHPYQHQQPALLEMLASLRLEVSRCRAAAQVNASQQAAQRALLERHTEQHASVTRELASRHGELERMQAAWDGCALAGAAPDEQERALWFGQLREQMRTQLSALDQQERAARDAAKARDMAQQAYDHSVAGLTAARAQAGAASTAQMAASAALSALSERHAQANDHLARLLDELEPVMTLQHAHVQSEADWRIQWRTDPRAYHVQRAAQAMQWLAQTSQQAARAVRLGELGLELAGAQARAAQASASEQAIAAQFAQLDHDIGTRRYQRAGLWKGRASADVEQDLRDAIADARNHLSARQQASQEATQAEVRVLETQAHLAARLAATRQQAADADLALAAWLDHAPDIAGLPALSALLALAPASLLAERQTLQMLDQAQASAFTVLAERRAQCLVHQQSAPVAEVDEVGATGGADEVGKVREVGVADLIQMLDGLAHARRQAQDLASTLALQIAQDDARRRNSQAMMAQVEQQEQIELRWGRMNELVGSADGKKFRNYAQQFTLDVLLGYANSHLQHLARRYRLERITTVQGPSLGLMVRDQDMGGEIRSVNSLSGGESFLVSLALALGLASLSSNRVRVESLFIDEGFGSLDSETLRVAMDALDGLQSMGRKVGVISHVQEMTERIATKVLVQPSGGGSSTVTVQ